MPDLETLIRSAARSGNLNHLSLAFIDGKWSASYRGVSDSDKRIVEHVDPVDAMVTALTGRKVTTPPPIKSTKRRLINTEDLL